MCQMFHEVRKIQIHLHVSRYFALNNDFHTILAKFESSGLLDNDTFFFYIIVNDCICIKIVIILLVEVVSPTMLRGKTSNGFYN